MDERRQLARQGLMGLPGVGPTGKPGEKKERPWAYACIAATAFDLSWLVWEREDD